MTLPSFLDLWTHRLDPMRAEVHFRLHSFQPGIDLRGRLMGPRCRFTTTIEIAYPIRPTATAGEYSAIIPEPSLWEPAKPFLYEGPVERFALNGAVEAGRVCLCFRTLKLGPKGLLLNGKSLQLHGTEFTQPPDENRLLELRGRGFNAVLVEDASDDICELADRLGFLLIVREKPGEDGQESFYCQVDSRPDSGKVLLPGIARQTDGSFFSSPNQK